MGSFLAEQQEKDVVHLAVGSGSIGRYSGEFTSPNGGVKPPLHQIDPVPSGPYNLQVSLFSGRRAPKGWGSQTSRVVQN
jgi:hypothetical protein